MKLKDLKKRLDKAMLTDNTSMNLANSTKSAIAVEPVLAPVLC